MNQQVYKKVGRKYIPLGFSDGWQGFPTDGIWLVQSTPARKSSECILKVADNTTVIPYAANLVEHKENIIKYISKNSENISILNMSINDFVNDMLKYISKQQENGN